MKILQVVHGAPPRQRAGTEIYAYNLSMELAKNHEVHLFYPIYTIGGAYSLRSFERDKLKIHELEQPATFLARARRTLFFVSSFVNKAAEIKFEGLLERINPDIVHFQHLMHLSAGLVEIAKSKNIPAIMTIHDFWLICPRIYLWKSNHTVCSGPDDNGENCYECWSKGQAEELAEQFIRCNFAKTLTQKLMPLIFEIANQKKVFRDRKKCMETLLPKVDNFIAPSRFVKNVFVGYGIPKDKIVCSSHGYDLHAFAGFKKSKNKTLVFGFVGGTRKHKGIHIVLEAFKRLKASNVKLKIYGIPKHKIKELRDKEKEENIELSGYFEDVRKPYSQIDVLIVASVSYESFCLVVQEAFATKTPIIASNIKALNEFVVDGKNGLLFKPGDPIDLANKMQMFLDNHDLTSKLREGIPPVKLIKKQAQELESIYYSCLARSQHVTQYR